MICLGFSLSSFTQAAGYDGGSGSENDPYQIRTPEQMNTIGVDPNDWDKHFILMNDIDMSGYTGTEYNIIGNTDINFTGSFDGQGYAIRNLSFTTSEAINDVGLFGCIVGAVIQDLGVENVSLTTAGNYVGGLAGWYYEGGALNCYVTGFVSGNNYIGGLVGLNEGVLVNCNANSSVSGTTYIGGLIGFNDVGCLTACYSAGSVSGSSYVGGLIGQNDDGILTVCYATGSVGGTSYTGGLLGKNRYGSLNACYATGLTSGTNYVGGFAGGEYSGELAACFWDTETTGQTTGLGTGSSSGTSGLTTEQMQTFTTFTDAGWDFSGETTNGYNDYWYMETGEYPCFATHTWALAGQGTSENPYIITDAEGLGQVWLKANACYRLGCNLDLTGISWSSAIIPAFAGDFDGQGFSISNITIDRSACNYIGLFGCIYSGRIQNLSIEFTTLNGQGYTGGLAGCNFYGTLLSCTVTGPVNGEGGDVGGLVGYNHAAITDCHMNDSVSGVNGVGGVAGWNEGDIISCSSVGSVSGNYFVGGLTGCNKESITTCYAAGSVSGNNYVGGVAGRNNGGHITACYATSSVQGGSWIGGLVGRYDDGLLTSSYAAGEINGTNFYIGGLVGYNYSSDSIITSCFWDTETSNTSTGIGAGYSSTGATGKTTSEMMTLATFTSEGWDFTNETLIGTNDIWRMCTDGIDYPRLNWESTKGDFACSDGVNTEDLDFYLERWMLQECSVENNYCGGADLDYSGSVDLSDFALFAGNWLLEN